MPKADNKEWPECRVGSLKQLAKDGYSAREIVDRLWLEGFKTTRNAVIGKAHRLKIELSFKSAGYLQTERKGRKGKMPNTDLPPSEPMGKGCLWPMGDKWCGCDRKEDSPYCTVHHKKSRTGQRALTEKQIKRLISG